jgi:hypothetical protein
MYRKLSIYMSSCSPFRFPCTSDFKVPHSSNSLGTNSGTFGVNKFQTVINSTMDISFTKCLYYFYLVVFVPDRIQRLFSKRRVMEFWFSTLITMYSLVLK